MNPDDDKTNRDDTSRDADNFHIAPEYGEQGEGPGEEPVRRIEITEVASEIKTEPEAEADSTADSATNSEPAKEDRFNHGADDVMHYFTSATDKEEAAETKPEPATIPSAPAPRKKTNLISTIAIVMITVLVTAVAVFIILLITQGHSSENQITAKEPVSQVETSSITCTTDSLTDEQKDTALNPERATITVIANFADDDLDDYSERTVYTYSDSSAAKSGLENIKNAYTAKVLDLINQPDPFSSTYSQKDKTVTVSHFAAASDLSFENMELLNIPKTNGTNPDIDAVKAALEDAGYTCKVKSAE